MALNPLGTACSYRAVLVLMRNSTSALGQNTSLGLVLIDSLDYHLNKQQTNDIFYSFTLTVLADKVVNQNISLHVDPASG